jgi:hypothetical protein
LRPYGTSVWVQAPFFLPTLPGLEPVFAPEKQTRLANDDAKAPAQDLETPAKKQKKTRKSAAKSLPGWGGEGSGDAGGEEEEEEDAAEEASGAGRGTAGGARGGIGESKLISLAALRPSTKFVKLLRRAGAQGLIH